MRALVDALRELAVLMEPMFFETPAKFRAWLRRYGATRAELIVGFYKKASGRRSITYPEAVDVALCFGWIDGVRNSVDAESYCNRFTPRRRGSNWSTINIKRAQQLADEGLMTPAGLAAFAARTGGDRAAAYSYEQRQTAALSRQQTAEFREHPGAWVFYRQQPPSYRKAAAWWVISAKKPETRARRLQTLIDCSARHERIPPLTRPAAQSA